MKTLVKMKVIFVIVISVLITGTAFAQVNKSAFEKRIFISTREVRIDTLLKIFSRQTGVEFSFNSNQISPSKKLSVPKQNNTLSQWLQTIHQTTGARHKVVGNHIILVDNSNLTSTNQNRDPLQKHRERIPQAGTKKLNSLLATNAKTSKRKTNQSQIKNVAAAGKSYHSSKTSVLPENKKSSINPNDPPSLDRIEANQKLTIVANTAKMAVDTLADAVNVKIKDTASVTSRGTPSNDQEKPSEVVFPQVIAPASAKKDVLEVVPVLPLSTIDLGPEGLALSFDMKMSNKIILDFSFGLGAGYAITDTSFNYKLNIRRPEPYSSLTTRYYYNRSKRAAKGRSVSMNSGDFVGLKVKYVTDYLIENFNVWDALLINVHWGMQRSVGPHLLITGHVGAGYGMTAYFKSFPTYRQFYPSVNFTVSYRISRQRD